MIYYKTKGEAPSWLGTPYKMDYTDYYVYCPNEPIVKNVVNVKWVKLTDDIEYYISGEYKPKEREVFEHEGVRYVKTPCGSSVPIYPITTKKGDIINVPCVYDKGDSLLTLEWGVGEDGGVVRQATEGQNAVLNTAKDIYDSLRRDELNLDLTLVSRIIGMALSYSYEIHPNEALTLGLCDDFVAVKILMAFSGFMCEEVDING